MADLLLGPMLRHVTETSATVWVETDRACSVSVLGHTARTFCVAGHHYALVVVDDLTPASSTRYHVMLDGVVRWPSPDSELPPSRIRTLGGAMTAPILFGSCRTAAPHEPPWSMELTLDPRGRGVDALYAYACDMAHEPEAEWPLLAIFLGDQIYADDSSPKAREKIAARRADGSHPVETGLPSELADGFEEYTWLYQESWSPRMERWFLANVPTVMIFDDHEMIDDWNISAAWVDGIRKQAYWEHHVTSGLMTYWIYQHLGNLSPAVIESEGLLASLHDVDDGAAMLREWAMGAEEYTPVAGRYRFHFHRDIGNVRLVMIDARNERVLTPGARQIVDDEAWEWMVEACNADVDHLLIGSSLPVFVPGGLHDLQVWNEAICDGSWRSPGRRIGERIRIALDMEDWPAFIRSFESMVMLLRDIATRPNSPATISLLSGDIHFSYAAQLLFPEDEVLGSTVHQLVSSPIRNALKAQERTVMRLGTSRFARLVGHLLRHVVHRKRATVTWSMDLGPTFANTLGVLRFDGRDARLAMLHTEPDDTTTPDTPADPVLISAFDIDLVAGARSQATGLRAPENADG